MSSLGSLAPRVKWCILVVLVVISGVSVKLYVSSRLKQASALMEQANECRAFAEVATRDAEKYKSQANRLQDSLDKANAKLAKLQAALDAVVVPPAPTSVPAVQSAIVDLGAMGLELIQKPSVTVAPSVAGITGEGVQKVWYWGQQASRVPQLELKVGLQGDMIKGLDKAKTIAESLAEARAKEAASWEDASTAHQKEALALRGSLTDTQKALKAERKLKVYYALGAAALTYAASRR